MHKPGLAIDGDFYQLPIFSGSIDLVILPHTLEYVDNPRQLLSESCRIVKPEGFIMILGFNPYSFWGLKRLLKSAKDRKQMPWCNHFIHASMIKRWLTLADFELVKHSTALLSSSVNRQSKQHKTNILEAIGLRCLPFIGGVYMIMAKAKVIPLKPIRLKWKQQISGLGIRSAIPGHIAHFP
jgi:ubiquinone/menaquinone biosynthesis C-methylase UbiE